MLLSQRIQAKTDNGDTVIDFLIEVMHDHRDGFKICHRLGAARLLTMYGCSCKSADAQADQAIDFIIDNPPELSTPRADSDSSRETKFDIALAKKIRESTDDGASVCRFLINVMEGHLKSFGPHHRISAARELLSRGFGKHARQEARASLPKPDNAPSPLRERAGVRVNTHPSTDEGDSHSESSPVIPANAGIHEVARPSATHPSNEEPSHSDDSDWHQVNTIVTDAIEHSKRTAAQQAEQDPDNPPYTPDYSAFDQAMKNSRKWFQEWKDSLDPDEYEAITAEKAANFIARLDARIQRRKQIAEDRERRAKEDAEREDAEAQARAEAQAKAEAKEAEDPGPPPRYDDHQRWSPTPNIPTSYRLRNCGHPRCKLHDGPIYYPEDDRSSPYYYDGSPMAIPATRISMAEFNELHARRTRSRPPYP